MLYESNVNELPFLFHHGIPIYLILIDLINATRETICTGTKVWSVLCVDYRAMCDDPDTYVIPGFRYTYGILNTITARMQEIKTVGIYIQCSTETIWRWPLMRVALVSIDCAAACTC
jgi:hypothetical protein